MHRQNKDTALNLCIHVVDIWLNNTEILLGESKNFGYCWHLLFFIDIKNEKFQKLHDSHSVERSNLRFWHFLFVFYFKTAHSGNFATFNVFDSKWRDMKS